MEASVAQERDLEKRMEELEERVRDLATQVDEDRMVIGVISGDLDKIMASFIIATGAAAMDTQVDMFFTFWGTAAMRDPKASPPPKSFIERMFGWMLPKGVNKLPLSKLNFLGMGPKLIRSVMKRHGAKSLDELIEDAAAMGVRIWMCQMSMELMGIKPQEIRPYPHLEYCGVAKFVELASRAKQTFFL